MIQTVLKLTWVNTRIRWHLDDRDVRAADDQYLVLRSEWATLSHTFRSRLIADLWSRAISHSSDGLNADAQGA